MSSNIEPNAKFSNVNHPSHYNQHPSGVECIDIIETFPYNIGVAIKYLWRAEFKNGIEDLEKAIWSIQREIDRKNAMIDNHLEEQASAIAGMCR